MPVLAAVATSAGELSIERISLYRPDYGQVRVRLTAAGVCHSDLSLLHGTLPHLMPAALGHEGAGIVLEVGPGVADIAPGDQVVLSWRPACRGCRWCLRGQPYLCASGDEASQRPLGTLAGGAPVFPALGVAAFAQETVVPANAVIVVPPDVEPATAALLGCAAMTAYGAVRGVAPGDTVAVIGAGGVGLIALQAARLRGAEQIIAVDASPAKEPLARICGATDFLVAGEDTVTRIRELTGGVDHAIECVGSAATIRCAWDATRRGGVTTVVGAGGRDQQVTFSALELFHSAKTLVGCLHGNTDPVRDLPALLAHVRTGAIDLGVVVTDRIRLDEVPAAFARMSAREGGRSLVLY